MDANAYLAACKAADRICGDLFEPHTTPENRAGLMTLLADYLDDAATELGPGTARTGLALAAANYRLAATVELATFTEARQGTVPGTARLWFELVTTPDRAQRAVLYAQLAELTEPLFPEAAPHLRLLSTAETTLGQAA